MIAAETQGIATRGFATHGPDAKFQPFNFARRELGLIRPGEKLFIIKDVK